MWLVDSLRSFVTGLGTAKDKTTSLAFAFVPLTDEELNAMHRSDWLARKIVDIIPNDMTREWRDWQAKGDQIEKIEAVEKLPTINLQVKVNEALRKARLLGGAGIYIGMRDGTPAVPLDIDRIGAGDLLYLHVLTRREVTAGDLERDIRSEFYGQPSYYEINAGGTQGRAPVRIHPSRFVRFVGADVLDTRTQDQQGWGDSILQIVYDAIQNAASAQQHTASLIPEAKTDVIYVPGLSSHLQNQSSTKALTDRFTYANTMKSMFNMLLLEGNGANGDQAQGERWEQKQLNFSQLPELMQQYLRIAAGAADITLVRLLQDAPSGLGSNGESGLKSYYDNIASRQRTELGPQLQRLDEIVIRSALGSRDPAIFYEWAPLWGLSDKEKADIFKTKADAARQIAGNGTSPPLMPVDALSDALVNELVEDGSLSGLEAAIEEYGKLSEQEEDEADVRAALPATDEEDEPERQATNDAAPRTLYVRRDLLNGADVRKWALAQGFTTTLEPSDMHVTITFSRQLVDWMKMGESWSGDSKGTLTVKPGGARLVEKLGPSATVLLFNSSELSWRHEDMMRNGASFDFDEYQPHITISYTGAPEDLSKVEPYRGELHFGPEIFEELNEDWKAGVKET